MIAHSTYVLQSKKTINQKTTPPTEKKKPKNTPPHPPLRAINQPPPPPKNGTEIKKLPIFIFFFLDKNDFTCNHFCWK